MFLVQLPQNYCMDFYETWYGSSINVGALPLYTPAHCYEIPATDYNPITRRGVGGLTLWL